MIISKKDGYTTLLFLIIVYFLATALRLMATLILGRYPFWDPAEYLYAIQTYPDYSPGYYPGFFAILIDAISPMFDVNVNLKQDRYHYCPMCANKIDLSEGDVRFCTVCGYNLDADLTERGFKK